MPAFKLTSRPEGRTKVVTRIFWLKSLTGRRRSLMHRVNLSGEARD